MLKKSDKKEFVEKMFDISIFEEMYKSIHRNVLDYDKESIACQHRLLTLNKTKDTYETNISSYEEQKTRQLSELTNKLNELRMHKE
jgi:DNA repair exonuclease SbcCD ATPase subunit